MFLFMRIRASPFEGFSSSSNLHTIWAPETRGRQPNIILEILLRQSNTHDFQQRFSEDRNVIDSVLNNAVRGSFFLLVVFAASSEDSAVPRFKLPQARGRRRGTIESHTSGSEAHSSQSDSETKIEEGLGRIEQIIPESVLRQAYLFHPGTPRLDVSPVSKSSTHTADANARG